MPKWKPLYDNNHTCNANALFCFYIFQAMPLPLSTNRTLSQGAKNLLKMDDKVKIAALKLSVYIECDKDVLTINHLSEILVDHGQGSPLGEIKLHRTKCISLIKNIISPSLKSKLIEDLK